MGLAFQHTGRVKSRADIFLDDPENRHEERKMMSVDTFRQILSNLFVLSGLTFVLYCVSLYFSAYVDIGEFIGSSQSDRAERAKASVKQMPRVRQTSLLSPIKDRLATDRFYMLRGQSVLVTYSLPKNAKLRLTIQQCKIVPMVEIFKCILIGEEGKTINNRTTGYVEFTASRPGFYHFQESVVKPQNVQLTANIDYQVVWQRGAEHTG